MAEAPFPLVESVFVALLRGIEGHSAGTSLPAELEAVGVFHRVSRGPGGDDGTTDAPLVDVETFAPRRLAASQAAEQARQVVLAARATNTPAGALLDDVTTASGPTWLDYKNPAVHRYVHSYRVALRR